MTHREVHVSAPPGAVDATTANGAAPPTGATGAPPASPGDGGGAAPAPAPQRREWRYRAVDGRDLRLDFLRGFAVFAMVADHIAGASWLYALTGGNRFFVSAAEGFVFISGVVVGIVYGGRVRAGGLRAVLSPLLRRAWLLYALAVWLAIATAFLAGLVGLAPAAPFTASPARFIVEVLTLRRTFYLVDVLLLYLFVMLLTPLALALLQRRLWWLLAAISWSLWAAYQFAPEALTLPWPIESNPVFNFAPWQVLYFTGLILGFHRDRPAGWLAAGWPASRAWVAARAGLLGVLTGVFGLLVWLHVTNAAAFDPLAPGGDAAAVLDRWFDKSALPPARLAACAIVFALCWLVTTEAWRPLRAACGPVLLTFGQGALYAYAAHLFLVPFVQATAEQFYGRGEGGGFPRLHPGVNSAIQVAALAVLWAMTRARLLQSLVAPLGGSPVGRARLPRCPRAIWRPGDSLAAVLLVGLVAYSFVRVPGATAPSEPAGAGARPTTTVIAPRRVGGAARGSGGQQGAAAPQATRTVTNPRSIGDHASGSRGTQTPGPVLQSGGYLLDGEFYSDALGRTMPYGIYLPPGYDGDARRYPVLYLLHGIGSHYSEWVEYGLAETAEQLIHAGQIPPLIIVLPQGDSSYFVNHTTGERWGDYLAIDVVSHIDTTYRTVARPDTRAIGGLSMGGFGALSIAFTRPDIFGVAGAHSPSLRTFDEAPPFLDDEAHFARCDPLQLAADLDPATAPRLWLDVGEEDQWATRVIALHELLADRNIRHSYSVTSGDHDSTYWSAHNADYLRFYTAAFLATGQR